MYSSSIEKSKKGGYICHDHDLSEPENLSECHKCPLDTEEDEDEDVDFNPFLKETPSLEASSSLDSELECLDAGVVDSGKNRYEPLGFDLSKLTSDVQCCSIGNSEHGEEILAQTTVSTEGASEKELQNVVSRSPKKTKLVLSSKPEVEINREKDNDLSSRTDVNILSVGEVSNTTNSQKPILDLDDGDAICKRTRARYSLASFTLDELETFLQETDDDEDLQNVDDEEEYRKFLAAVLLGKDGDCNSTLENENVDDEDEDNDADFEIELEEALESDIDESMMDKPQKDKDDGVGRRPETRQIRRQKASAQHKNRLLGQAKRPLRPLLPNYPNTSIAPLLALDGKRLMPEAPPSCLSSKAEDGYINGFSPHQIGQLHCLIHEHVQLLIQAFSLCVLDPSRKQIASQVQGLLLEMLHKRDEVLTCKSIPYPGFCFHPPYVSPSVSDEFPAQCTSASSLAIDAQGAGSAPNNIPSQGISSSIEGCYWVPYTNGPVLSILDVAPLNLFGRYKDNVYAAVKEYQRCNVESSFDTRFEKEPLFPLPCFRSFAQANCHDSGGGTSPTATKVSSTIIPQPPKKTIAAAIVESTKKQSVALVPKEIAKLAQRFFPLFNPALFPHKPPHAAVANRFLFTAAEDELLASGMMEYNTDWEAIQQRFLPCKSKHQIFVRQKNRCSSKAPDNCIKAVRRMKTSPLTAVEIECIQEGLRIFNLDWMSVWKFFVPHRDPSLLPRQWRTALGIQRSYKHDAAEKEKRRAYEAKRRLKSAALANWQTGKKDYQVENADGENNSGDDCTNADEAYVHEAFLADWRPGTYSLISSEHPRSSLGGNYIPCNMFSQASGQIREQPNNCGSGSQNGNMHECPSVSKCSQHPSKPSHVSRLRHCASNTFEANHSVSNMNLTAPKSHFSLRPYRARRTNNPHIVKLAPDLPPVNLPPSVRVISHSLFQRESGKHSKVSTSECVTVNAPLENSVPPLPRVAKLGTTQPIKARSDKDSVTNLCTEGSEFVKDSYTVEERGTDSDIQMHPLLFQAPQDGHMFYSMSNDSTSTSSSFSFFSGNQPQLNLSLFHNPLQANFVSKPFSTSCGIDFHPLLQSDELNNDVVTACSTAKQSVGFKGKSDKQETPFDPVRTESMANKGASSTLRTGPSIPNPKANDLDLEIYLSSTSRKERATGDKNVTAHISKKSMASVPDSGASVENCNKENSCYQQVGNGPMVSSNLVSKSHVLAEASNNVSRYTIEDIGEQSHQQIVMEQEELSDSDEDIEENVEFECEEMADSEAEESGSEQSADIQNKDQDQDAQKSATERAVTDDSDEEQCRQKNNDHPQDNACSPNNPLLTMYLLGQANETSSRSWLSLDSQGPDFSFQETSKHDEDKTSQLPTTKESASSYFKLRKRTNPSTKNVTEQKHDMDMTQQLSLSSAAVPVTKKPRKPACRPNRNMQTELTVKNSMYDNSGTENFD